MPEQSPLVKNLFEAIPRLEAGESIPGDELARLVSDISSFEIEEGGPYASKHGGDIKDADIGLNLLIAYFLLLCKVELPKLDVFLDKHLAASKSSILSADDLNALAAKLKERKRLEGGQEAITAAVYDPEEQRAVNLVMKKFEERFAGFSSEIRDGARKAIEKTIRGNRDKQMPLMAYYTKQALGKRADAISDALIAEMGLANIFFWTAFIIYDDFWDEDEAMDPKILPVANIFARHYTDFFSSLLPASPARLAEASAKRAGGTEDTKFRAFFHALMDRLDEANAWETRHCRARVDGQVFHIPETLPEYGDYEIKYRPASGHILGSVALLVMLGYRLDSPEARNFIAYFKHYLIAMQLNDDAHDWEEDMRRGHISTAVDLLLRDLNWQKKTIDLNADLSELKKVFWFNTMPKYARLAVSHTEKSLQALRSMTIFENTAPLERMITITESAAKKALKDQEDSVEFLKAYKLR